MRNFWAVYTRELRSYFVSPIFYILATVFVIVVGNNFKDTFFSWVLGEGETAGLAEVALGYGLVFVAAFILGEVVTRALGLNESEVREAY